MFLTIFSSIIGLFCCANIIVALDNFDTVTPIVKISPANDDTAFGFSVTVHQMVEPQDSDTLKEAIDKTM